jgi:hypothetical protein
MRNVPEIVAKCACKILTIPSIPSLKKFECLGPRHYTDVSRDSEVLLVHDAPIGRGAAESTTRLVKEHVPVEAA